MVEFSLSNLLEQIINGCYPDGFKIKPMETTKQFHSVFISIVWSKLATYDVKIITFI